MCLACTSNVPLCSVDGFCGMSLLQQLKFLGLGLLSVLGGIVWWARTRFMELKSQRKRVIDKTPASDSKPSGI